MDSRVSPENNASAAGAAVNDVPSASRSGGSGADICSSNEFEVFLGLNSLEVNNKFKYDTAEFDDYELAPGKVVLLRRKDLDFLDMERKERLRLLHKLRVLIYEISLAGDMKDAVIDSINPIPQIAHSHIVTVNLYSNSPKSL